MTKDEDIFMIVGGNKNESIFVGKERIARDIWYQLIMGNLVLDIEGEFALVKVYASHKFPV